MGHYLLRSVHIPQRPNFQTLIDTRTGLQPVLISLWADHLCSSCRPNTARAYLRDVILLLDWAEEMKISLADRFRSLQGLKKHEVRLLVKKYEFKADGSVVKASTYNRRIISTINFVNFHMERYLELASKTVAESVVLIRRIEKIIKYFAKLMKAESEIGLDEIPTATIPDLVLERLLQIAHPDSENNPYRIEALKIRNYCMLRASIECLLRRSELVLLELNDFEDSTTPTLRIKKPSEKNLLSNKDSASIKTHGRVLPISRETASWLQVYVEEARPLLRARRRASISLFISLRSGKRLSSNSANSYLKPLEKKYFELHNEELRIHSHMLRVTGSNHKKRISEEKLSDIPGLSRYMEVNEVMTYSGGWSPTSRMPRHYARDSIAAKSRSMLGETESEK